MKRCPACQLPFEERVLGYNRHYPDAVMQELFRRQEKSDLCLDCLLEEWAAELSEAQLRRASLIHH